MRGALLLYRPTETRGWIATIAFYASLGFFVGCVAFLASIWKGFETDDLWGLVVVLGACLVLVIAALGWASRYRPRAAVAAATARPVSAGVG